MFPAGLETNGKQSNRIVHSKPTKKKPKISTQLKYVFLIVVIILLVAQHRALQLPLATVVQPAVFVANGKGGYSQAPLSLEVDQIGAKNETRLVFVEPTSSSIDRHDRGSGDHEGFNSTSGGGSAKVLQELTANRLKSEGQLSNETTTTTTANLSLPADRVQLDPRSADLMFAAANTDLVRHAPIEERQADDVSMTKAGFDPNLAEMTATGTAMGLMVHDLLSQANVPQQELDLQEPMLSVPRSPDGHSLPVSARYGSADELTLQSAASRVRGMDEDGDQDEEAREPETRRQPMYNSLVQQTTPMRPSGGEIEAADEGEGEEDGNLRGQLGDDGGASSRMAKASGTIRQQFSGSSGPNSADAGPEPPGEEQMPDSMASLMRSEGENVQDEPEQSSQAAAGTSLVNQLNGAIDSGGQPSNDDDDDYDGDDGARESGATQAGHKLALDSRPQARHLDRLDEVSMMRSANGDQMLAAHQPVGGGETLLGPSSAGNLVAPMRDSLSDLNMAAGHYYGKKKKKKVKKIFIKKKKKKKKKYVKKKKVKVVVIKKKKPKKMKKHHYDHGKYYM